MQRALFKRYFTPVKIRERKGPSQGVVQHSEPCERSTYAPKLEDRSQEETLQQERCARRDAWEMAKIFPKLKENDQATFHSPSEVWSLPAPSSTESKERECVVVSGAPMHMLSSKDLNLAELGTVRVSRNPTTVITANGEVQMNEEATVYVYDLDFFVTVQFPQDTHAVMSLGKLCEEHGYSFEWASGQKPHFSQWQKNPLRHGKQCTDRCPRNIDRFFQFDCKYVSYIVTAGLN